MGFFAAVAETAARIGNGISTVIGLVGLALSALAGWRFGVAWGVVVVLAVLLLLVAATGVRVQRELATSKSEPTMVSSPNPITALHWEDGDYRPVHSKSWPGPKKFSGGPDPATVPGVVVNQYDEWINPDVN